MKRQRAELTKEIKQVERFLATEEIGLDLEALKNEVTGAADLDGDDGYGQCRHIGRDVVFGGGSVASDAGAGSFASWIALPLPTMDLQAVASTGQLSNWERPSIGARQPTFAKRHY